MVTIETLRLLRVVYCLVLCLIKKLSDLSLVSIRLLRLLLSVTLYRVTLKGDWAESLYSL